MAASGVGIRLARGKAACGARANGAGKTTLINLLSGDLPRGGHTPTYKGADITRYSSDPVRAS